jgi:Tfp pilus assembly protein PilF
MNKTDRIILIASITVIGTLTSVALSCRGEPKSTKPEDVSPGSIFFYGSVEKARKEEQYQRYLESGKSAFNTKNFAEAEKQFSLALKQRGGSDEESEQWLAKTYLREGKIEQAETLSRKTATSAEAQHDGITIIDCLASLAEIYRAQHKYSESETVLRRELAVATQRFDENEIHKPHGNWTGLEYLAASMIHLAVVLQAEHKDAEAEALFARALRLEEAGIGTNDPEDPDLILDIVMQANLYRKEKRDAKFEADLYKSLNMNNSPDVVIRLDNLAALAYAAGKYSKAEAIIADAIEQSHACPYPATEANLLKNLAEAYMAEGKFKEAKATLNKAIEMSKESLGAGHPIVATILDVQRSLTLEETKKK